MSKINILGIINSIRSKSNIYTPVIEAIVNSIDAITESQRKDGEIIVTITRDAVLLFDDTIPEIKSIEIQDNGIGFTKKNRDSFDTLYSYEKKTMGGKGFGRFMFLKYFGEVKVDSIYLDTGVNKWFHRSFNFGKQFDIIIEENNVETKERNTYSKIQLNNVLESGKLEKNLETISRKILEKILVFFVNEKFICPTIILREADGSKQIVLNHYLTNDNEISLIANTSFTLKGGSKNQEESFNAKVFKIFFANYKSKISLTAHNREVTETTLQTYVPEFEDDFFDEILQGNKSVRKNYIVKAYVLGKYLNDNVSLERETFNFDKDKGDDLHIFSQSEIERKTAEILKDLFKEDVNVRADRKKERVVDYVNSQAPWHRLYLNDIDLSTIPYTFTDEKLELELQKIKFNKEQETRAGIRQILSSENDGFDDKFSALISKITEIGKSDLAHYVCNRKITLTALEEVLRRDENGNPKLEEEVHNLIFPMRKDTQEVCYEDHNLWLLDERLVFSEYIASDKKISKKKDAGEPDLVIFDQKKSFRNGDNEFSNPLTIFEFKRPKRENYKQEDDPILQIGSYVDDIRSGKYEMPKGLEKIKVNVNTPIYGYVICDLTKKIKEFARQHQLTISPDEEGYFGFHRGYGIYIEIMSFKKILKDANLRNKIFFKKLQLE
jgi:hypothetical protein